jgi:hypothetical protein
MVKNQYNFVSKFSKFISVKFYHNFYNDNLLKGLEISVEKETGKLLQSHGILIRFIENGFTLICKKEPKFELQSFAGELKLIFFLKIKNSYFLNITDIPFSNNQKFLFQNTQDVSSEKLHPNVYVDENNIQKSADDGIFGEICLNINSKNQFFGSETAGKILDELIYSIHFNARKVKFRYNFFSKSNVIEDFGKYFITDEQNSFKLNNHGNRILANGTSVYFMIIEDEILASQTYSSKLYLKKDDDFLTYFSIFLPFPKAKTISYDINENVYFNDVFVGI